MIYDWIGDLLNNTIFLLDMDSRNLNKTDKFKKDLYKFTKGFSAGKDSEKLAKISTNVHDPNNESIEHKLRKELYIYKKRNEAIKNHVIAYLKMYERKIHTHYTSTYTNNMFNFYRAELNKIEAIEKEYPLEEQ